MRNMPKAKWRHSVPEMNRSVLDVRKYSISGETKRLEIVQYAEQGILRDIQEQCACKEQAVVKWLNGEDALWSAIKNVIGLNKSQVHVD
jgi:hypothetical protein